MTEANYTRSETEIDAHTRHSTAEDPKPFEAEYGRSFQTEDSDIQDYVGTSAEYANYANEGEKPYPAESGIEAWLENEAAKAANAPLAESVKASVGSDDEGNVKDDSAHDGKKASETVPPAAPNPTAAPPASASTPPPVPPAVP